MRTQTSDEALLRSEDPEAFGLFYARHLSRITAFFAHRVGDRELAADLAAETFASALVARRRFEPGPTPAVAWLYTIAARRLADARRRQGTQRRALDAVAFERPVGDEVVALDGEALLRHLPAEQRAAVLEHVIHGRAYEDLAAALATSEASVRQRVSRGLRTLRDPLRFHRAASELAAENRAYRFGGGHGRHLAAVAPSSPLDCSSAASLVLARAGMLPLDRAQVSTELAEWGEEGEGRYATLWADEGHVWLEFTLDGSRERFDPTPSRLAPRSGWLSTRPGPKASMAPRHWPGL
jgi:RNA polymerase sigma factor (sigma-70 family)